MPRLLFSKSALQKEIAQLKRYQKFLPSLDLKRQQLIIQRNRQAVVLAKIVEQIEACRSAVAEFLPMISDQRIILNDLVSVASVSLAAENCVGVNLPVFQSIQINVKPYSIYAKPHWVDHTVKLLQQMIELQVRFKIEQQRMSILQAAVKKVTQRVNFFDKILIPRAKQTIKKIGIFLSDKERAGIVNAKITKQKRLNKGSPCP